MERAFESQHLRRAEKMTRRIMGFDVIQRALVEQTLGKLYRGISAKIALKIQALSQQLMPPLIEQLTNSVPRNSIIEINCGYGFLANYLSLSCSDADVVGIDLDARKIAQAKESIGYRQNLKFIAGDIEKLPKIEADLIIFHVEQWDATVSSQLNRIYQWLSPGGDVLVCTRHAQTRLQAVVQSVFSGYILSSLLKREQLLTLEEVLPQLEQNSSKWEKRLTKSGLTCLAEYNAAQSVQSIPGKIAAYLNQFIWYHAEKPIFQTNGVSLGLVDNQFESSAHSIQYGTALNFNKDMPVHAKLEVKHDSEDVLEYIFAKPWKSLKQEITLV